MVQVRCAGAVRELWRYPVKSLAGERLSSLRFDERGAEFDRVWALVSSEGAIASGKTTRRFLKVPGLLRHSSRVVGDVPIVKLADGREARGDAEQLAELVEVLAGPGWSFQREGVTPHFDAAAVHVVTTATLATLSAATREAIAVERLRPNLVLEFKSDGFPEESWIGTVLRIGEVELRVVGRTERCVMVNHAQKSLAARARLLKAIGGVNAACAGVYADVVVPGTIRTGDVAHILPGAQPSRANRAGRA